MSAKLELDTSQITRALKEYQEATKKDFPEVVNRAAVNVALRAAQFTRKADKGSIQALENQPWWPRFIAKYFRERGATFSRTSSAKKYGPGKSTVRRFIKGASYTQQQAKALSRRIIASRVRAVSFIRSGWIPAIRILAPYAKVPLRVVDAKKYGVDKGSARWAKPGFHPVSEISNSVKGSGLIGSQPLHAAINFVAKDMIDYARKKMIETARRHSVRR